MQPTQVLGALFGKQCRVLGVVHALKFGVQLSWSEKAPDMFGTRGGKT